MKSVFIIATIALGIKIILDIIYLIVNITQYIDAMDNEYMSMSIGYPIGSFINMITDFLLLIASIIAIVKLSK